MVSNAVRLWYLVELCVLMACCAVIATALRLLWPDAPGYAWLLVWLFVTKWILVIVFDALKLREAPDGE